MRAASHSKRLTWALVATLGLAALVWACSDSATSPSAEPTPPAKAPEAGLEPEPEPEPEPVTPPVTGLEATEPNLKVAFVADTGTGNDFRSVLQLIKRENTDLVLFQGDLNYALLGRAGPWFDVMDEEIDVPYFLAKGNHDVDWNGYASGLETRMTTWGITAENGEPSKRNYSVVYKGLKLVFVDESETTPKRAEYVKDRLAGDKHVWKICAWHKNQRAANVGPKGDEMGWAIYESCRSQGAIVAQGHSHTYSRSKTLTNDASQTVDATCSDPFNLCVGPGRHFFFDSSVGGEDVRPPEANVANKPYWGATSTGSFGALFLEFNVGGDPNKAEGYFKTTADVVLDPPASSGKTRFTITRTP